MKKSGTSDNNEYESPEMYAFEYDSTTGVVHIMTDEVGYMNFLKFLDYINDVPEHLISETKN